jgi:Cystathionine beta-lyases/cystathionine gamma-synthases
LLWEQDALYLERNSRDFASRAAKIDDTTLETVKLLQNCDLIAQVYHPSISPTKHHYDSIRNADGGYGGLISFVFHEEAAAICFFNTVNIHKGPSLGTNFTLACPYAILAHYHELDEIAQWGVDRNLIRISIGLEEPRDLLAILQHSLNAASKIIK